MARPSALSFAIGKLEAGGSSSSRCAGASRELIFPALGEQELTVAVGEHRVHREKTAGVTSSGLHPIWLGRWDCETVQIIGGLARFLFLLRIFHVLLLQISDRKIQWPDRSSTQRVLQQGEGRRCLCRSRCANACRTAMIRRGRLSSRSLRDLLR